MQIFEDEIRDLVAKAGKASSGSEALSFANAASTLVQLSELELVKKFGRSSTDAASRINSLMDKASNEDSSSDALKFSQTALNLASIETMRKVNR